jgi:hypothetical protein
VGETGADTVFSSSLRILPALMLMFKGCGNSIGYEGYEEEILRSR